MLIVGAVMRVFIPQEGSAFRTGNFIILYIAPTIILVETIVSFFPISVITVDAGHHTAGGHFHGQFHELLGQGMNEVFIAAAGKGHQRGHQQKTDDQKRCDFSHMVSSFNIFHFLYKMVFS